MSRVALSCSLALLLPLAARAELPAGLKDVHVLQEAFQKAIADAEPSIACILVSRNEAYRQYQKAPVADNSGTLGGFDPKRVPQRFDESETQKMQRLDLSDPNNVPESFGSGVVIDDAGLLLTNYHVVRDAVKIYVRLPGDKGSYADIHAADPRSDLAVLKLIKPPGGLRAIKIGDGGALKKGQWILTLANPFAAGFRDGSPSASWGIISNLRRRAPGSTDETEPAKKTLHHFGTLVQTDARLNLGCSGGALLDLKGELIGLTTAIAALSGTEASGGYAVPMDAGMRRIIDVLKRGEEVEYGLLGVQLIKNARRGNGVQLSGVTPGLPAYRAGLRAIDTTILSVNGTPVHDNDELFLAIGTLLAGSQVKLEVRSGGTVSTKTVTLAKFYLPWPTIASRKPPAVRGLRVDHISVLLHSWPLQQPFPNGVVIREVQPGSAAANALLKVNDIITHVNGRPVYLPADFYREAQKVKGQLELTLEAARLVKVN